MKFNSTADTALWTKHYLDMAAGKVDSGRKYQLSPQPIGQTGNGLFVVEQSGGGGGIHTRTPIVNVMTPVAQGVEQAKASIKRSIKQRTMNRGTSSQKRQRRKQTSKKKKKKPTPKRSSKRNTNSRSRKKRRTKTSKHVSAKRKAPKKKKKATAKRGKRFQLDVLH